MAFRLPSRRRRDPRRLQGGLDQPRGRAPSGPALLRDGLARGRRQRDRSAAHRGLRLRAGGSPREPASCARAWSRASCSRCSSASPRRPASRFASRGAGESELPPRSGLCRVRGQPAAGALGRRAARGAHRGRGGGAAARTAGPCSRAASCPRPSGSGWSVRPLPVRVLVDSPERRRLASRGRDEGNRRSRSPSCTRTPWARAPDTARIPPDRPDPLASARIKRWSETGAEGEHRGEPALHRGSRALRDPPRPTGHESWRSPPTADAQGHGDAPMSTVTAASRREHRVTARSLGRPEGPRALLDAHRLRLHLRAPVRSGRHRRAAGRRLGRQHGAGPRHDPARDARRDGLPLPPGEPRGGARAGRRRHALRLLPGLARGRRAQRDPAGEGGRRRGREARGRRRARRCDRAHRGRRDPGDGARRPHAAIRAPHGRLSRAGARRGRAAARARRRARGRGRGRLRGRARGHAGRAGARDHGAASRSRPSASAPARRATARCSCCTTCSGSRSGRPRSPSSTRGSARWLRRPRARSPTRSPSASSPPASTSTARQAAMDVVETIRELQARADADRAGAAGAARSCPTMGALHARAPRARGRGAPPRGRRRPSRSS